MEKYISREAATVYAPLPKHLRNYQTENLDDAWEDGYDYAISQIDAIPAADVVEVVRCQKCIFRGHYKELDGTKISICTGAMAYICTPDDWYCANGKRKNGGQDDGD